MHKITTLAGALALASALSGCASLGQPTTSDGKQESWASAAVEIAKDSHCGHTDDIDIMIGPISQGHVKLNRTCPVPLAHAPTAGEAITKALVPPAPAVPPAP